MTRPPTEAALTAHIAEKQNIIDHTRRAVPTVKFTSRISGREEVPGGALLNGGRGLVAGYATRLSSFCIDTFAGRADEDELFQTRSKLWDRSEMLHGVAARGAY
jgi:hypothetical protein